MALNDWQKIDTFDEKVGWQRSLAIEVSEICKKIIEHFGYIGSTDDDAPRYRDWVQDSYYNDKVVRISSSCHVINEPFTRMFSINVYLASSDTKVLSTYHEPDRSKYEIYVFRVGSWLNHIESLKLRLEPKEKAEQQRNRQLEAEERKKRFGRLD